MVKPSHYLTLSLYRLAVAAYRLGIRIAAGFNPKARAWVTGRKHWRHSLRTWRATQPEDAFVLWMHCASLGEFEQGRPVLERIRKELPDHRIVLTFYSPSGYQQQASYPHADYVAYLPADRPANARDWVELLRPRAAIFVKYEFWADYLLTLFRNDIPTVLIGGVFRPGQLFFRWYGGFFLALLQGFEHLFVQRPADADLLRAHGLTDLTVAGDPRIDRVLEIAHAEIDFPIVAAFAEGAQLFVGGSTWPPGEQILLSDPKLWAKDWKLLLAPHDLSENHLQALAASIPLPYCRYSQQPTPEALEKARVLILDTIGMLSRVYHYGTLAYVGGGFGVSIHNTLEPAAHDLPIFIGPTHRKFPEALSLTATGGAFVIHDADEFQRHFRALQSPDRLAEARAAVQEFLRANAGATERIVQGLTSLKS